MERRPWLERVADELARRGVPAGYRSRLLAELADHIHDLTDEGSTMAEERLGTPEAVAAAAAGRLRGGWVRRHPMLVFGLAPVPVAVGAIIAAGFGLGGAVWAADALSGCLDDPATRPVVGRLSLYSMDFVFRFGVFAGTAAVFARCAARNRAGRWLIVAAAEIAVFAGCLTTYARYSDEPGKSSFGFSFPGLDGLSLADHFGRYLTVGHLLQVVVPLAVASGFWWRLRRFAGPVAAI